MRAGGGIRRQTTLPCLVSFCFEGGLIISLPFFFFNFKFLAVLGIAERENPAPL